ncbi:this family protein [Xylariaceae sp. FL0804]|nr:this family protein [Xylariaceae sp. FL0804]
MGAIPKPPAGHFNVLYFASAGSFTAREYDALPAPLTVPRLFDELERRYPGIRDRVLASCLVTVNLEYVDAPLGGGGDGGGDGTADVDAQAKQVVIKEGDEVAIIPPVSSG